ncbi:MAG TPA: hypothetical protein DCP63_04020 [Bacteroidetes bacterium]|nr:hypothetical protein [Bacteroidota bacterium]
MRPRSNSFVACLLGCTLLALLWIGCTGGSNGNSSESLPDTVSATQIGPSTYVVTNSSNPSVPDTVSVESVPDTVSLPSSFMMIKK